VKTRSQEAIDSYSGSVPSYQGRHQINLIPTQVRAVANDVPKPWACPRIAAPLRASLGPDAFGEDPPLGFRRLGKELAAVHPPRAGPRTQAHAGLVDQLGGLQRVPGSFSAHPGVGDRPELVSVPPLRGTSRRHRFIEPIGSVLPSAV
jgi:hypothetical protein